jgi:hypothetical protein
VDALQAVTLWNECVEHRKRRDRAVKKSKPMAVFDVSNDNGDP